MHAFYFYVKCVCARIDTRTYLLYNKTINLEGIYVFI